MKFEDHIYQGLDKAYRNIENGPVLPLGDGHKYVLFSDHHKGTKKGDDNFRQCEKTYLAALEYYLKAGYSLVIVGDAEELQQRSPKNILATYRQVMDREAAFHEKGRYFKIFGNHDYKWRHHSQVKKHLHPIFPNLEVKEGYLMEYAHPITGEKGQIMLTHGHQGTFDADRILWLARIGVWLYRHWQILTRRGQTRPSNNYRLRELHDRVMYTWANRKKNFVLMTGHTHRPIWTSKTYLEKLAEQLRVEKEKLVARAASRQHFQRSLESQEIQLNFFNRMFDLKKEMEKHKERGLDETNTVKSLPTYFNPGCCRYKDGDITGVEIDGDLIRLVKWEGEAKPKPFSRVIFEEDELASLFTDFDLDALLKTEPGEMAVENEMATAF